MPEPSAPTTAEDNACAEAHPIYKGMICALPQHGDTAHDDGIGTEWPARKPIAYAARPRIRLVRQDRKNPKSMFIARCEECSWIVGPTAKSWLTGTEMPAHRAAHRDAPKAGAQR